VTRLLNRIESIPHLWVNLFITGFVVFKLSVIAMAWRPHQRWRADVAAELAAAQAEVMTARIYDRHRSWTIPVAHRLWAEAGGKGVDLFVKRGVWESVRPGDTVEVAFLPKSRLVVSLNKIDAPGVGLPAAGIVEG